MREEAGQPRITVGIEATERIMQLLLAWKMEEPINLGRDRPLGSGKDKEKDLPFLPPE